jgi:hypothetical protein
MTRTFEALTSPAQHAFLAEWYDEFSHTAVSCYDEFFESIYEAWFARWPERDIYLAGIIYQGGEPKISRLGEAIIQVRIPKRREVRFRCTCTVVQTLLIYLQLIQNYFMCRKAAHIRQCFLTTRHIQAHLDIQ